MAGFKAGRPPLRVVQPDIPAEAYEARDDGHRTAVAERVEIVDPIDTQIRKTYEARIEDFEAKLRAAQAILGSFQGFVDERTLGAAAVNSAAGKVDEALQQGAVLRQVVRDLDPEWKASA